MDNGREFNNSELRDLCAKHGVRVLPTPPYSPWSNGLCERHNGVIAEMLQKTVEENPKMSLEFALRHVIFAKNCLEGHLGFTPYQLVLGHNPRLPSVLNDDIPALEKTSVSSVVAEHFKLLNDTRASFLRADCSERIKRAILGKVRYSDAPFVPGEMVFYKRDQAGPWHGPGRVIFHEGQELIVKDAGQIVTVHAFRASRVKPQNLPDSDGTTTNSVEPSRTDMHQPEKQGEKVVEMSWPSVPIVDDECPAQTTENSRIDGLEDDEQPYDQIEEVHADAPINSTEHTITERVCQKRPERGARVVFELTNDGSQLYTAKILCPAGKSTGKYKNWLNVQYEKPVELSGKIGSYNWFEDIRSWHYAPTDESVLIASNDEFSDAKQRIAKLDRKCSI